MLYLLRQKIVLFQKKKKKLRDSMGYSLKKGEAEGRERTRVGKRCGVYLF